MKKLAITLCLAITFAVPAFGQDPCSQTTKLSATASGAQSWNGTKSATTVGGSGDDAYGVEAWTEAGGNATKLTWFGPNQGGGYAFRAEWTNSTDYLGRFGYFWGNNGKKWSNLGDLCVDYNYTRSGAGTGGSYSYIGIYGWTIGSNNSAEYYIVEDWFGSGQQAANNLGNNCAVKGSNITVDGKTYQVVVCTRPAGSGCVSCNNQAFKQVFSIRQGMASNPPKCGTISISKHFTEWMKIPDAAAAIYDKTYESKFLVEAAGSTGWFEASYMKFSRTGACGVTIPAGNFTLTTAVSPSNGGTVTKSPNNDSYAPNASVTVTATAASGWKFDSWEGATGTTNSVTVTMNANKTVTAKFVPNATDPATNLIKNGTFTNTDNWTLNKWQNSAGTFAVSGGNGNITGITLPSGEGAAIHSLQLVQSGFTLIKGVTYRVSFDASAASARTMSMFIQMNGDPYTTYFGKDDISLTTQKQTFTYDFEMKEATDEAARIAFNFGNATPNVTLSNIKIGYAVGTISSSSGASSSSTVAGSSSSRASSSSVAAGSSSSLASSSSAVAGSSSSRASSSSVAAGSSSSSASSSSAAGSISSSGTTPILENRIPVTYFSVQTQSNKALRIEISSPSVVEIFDLRGNKAERFDVSSTSQTVQLSLPNGVYFAKVQGMKSVRFVLK